MEKLQRQPQPAVQVLSAVPRGWLPPADKREPRTVLCPRAGHGPHSACVHWRAGLGEPGKALLAFQGERPG